MKNFLIIIALLSLLACKKNDVKPEPETPDYADSLVGTYLGQTINYDGDNVTQLYNNGSKTMTVTKISKNKIQVSSFYGGPAPYFDLSDAGSGNITLNVSSSTLVNYGGASSNNYSPSTKILKIYFKYPSLDEYRYFSGTKQ